MNRLCLESNQVPLQTHEKSRYMVSLAYMGPLTSYHPQIYLDIYKYMDTYSYCASIC